jgi:hypothetical protein
MTETKIPISKIFTTIEDVQNECNFIELVLPGKLKSLNTIGGANSHITEGVFDRYTSDEFLANHGKLGKLVFTTGGTSSAWINGLDIKITFK